MAIRSQSVSCEQAQGVCVSYIPLTRLLCFWAIKNRSSSSIQRAVRGLWHRAKSSNPLFDFGSEGKPMEAVASGTSLDAKMTERPAAPPHQRRGVFEKEQSMKPQRPVDAVPCELSHASVAGGRCWNGCVWAFLAADSLLAATLPIRDPCFAH